MARALAIGAVVTASFRRVRMGVASRWWYMSFDVRDRTARENWIKCCVVW